MERSQFPRTYRRAAAIRRRSHYNHGEAKHTRNVTARHKWIVTLRLLRCDDPSVAVELDLL